MRVPGVVTIEDTTLLVSVLASASGRVRREIQARLRALGDPAAVVVPTGRAAAGAGRPGVPATLEALAASVPALSPPLAERAARVLQNTARPFRESVDLALELLGGVVPAWPALEEWNRWCVEHGARFFAWAPSRGELSDRERAEALLHTVMMLAAKAQALEIYRAAGVREVEVAMAGDDCVVCDEHRHAHVPLDAGAASSLPPFHPGCRCGFRPHLV
jgi:hypothetical protein